MKKGVFGGWGAGAGDLGATGLWVGGWGGDRS